MKLLIFSVYDKAVQAYLQPFYARSKGEALRQFTDACNDQGHQFAKHAADYTLVQFGEFDDASGMFDCAEPARIIGALECVADNVFPPDREVKSPRVVM